MAEQITIPTAGDLVAGRYRVVEEIGRGSYGIVFRAHQVGIDRDVALKMLLPQAFLNADIVTRFQREAALVSRLQHPNIVTLYDFGQSEGGALYMAMELIRGRPLSHVIAEEAPLAQQRAMGIVVQVLKALQAAHREGIVHRDLKPENIVLTVGAEGQEIIKILDFGIAKLTEANESALKTLTAQGYVLGTPHYMSPENITGDPVSDRSDLYAVGILLYELLSGDHPYDAPNPSAVLLRHLNDPLPRLPNAAIDRSPLGHAMRYALAKEPDERIPSAEEFINILEGRTEAPVVAPSRSGRWAILVGLVALLVIALGVWAIAAILSSEDAETQRPTSETTTNETPPVDLTVATTGVDRALDAAEQGSERSPEESESDVDAGPEPNAEAAADVGGEDADQIAETDSPKPVETPAASKLRFMSDPAGATVFVGGKPIGSTPVTTTVRGNDPVRVRFTKIGYKSKTMVVKPKLARQTVSVVLKPGRIKLTP